MSEKKWKIFRFIYNCYLWQLGRNPNKDFQSLTAFFVCRRLSFSLDRWLTEMKSDKKWKEYWEKMIWKVRKNEMSCKNEIFDWFGFGWSADVPNTSVRQSYVWIASVSIHFTLARENKYHLPSRIWKKNCEFIYLITWN